MYVDGALLDIDIAAPDAVEELLAGIDPIGVGHEELEHAVLGRPQHHRLVTGGDAVRHRVEAQALDVDDLAADRRVDPPQHRLDARHQLTGRERLGDIVIRTALEAGDFVSFLSARGEHDDRQFF